MDNHEKTGVFSTDPSDWKYLSEGGATIVYSYVGPRSPQFTGTVLRIRKVADALHEQGTEVMPEDDDPTISFQYHVIAKLFPSSFLPRLESIDIDGAFLMELERLTEGRPSERQRTGSIDHNLRKAVLADNLVGGPGWAVEIKPKWGFLPNPVHLSNGSREAKTTCCRFCLHSKLRLQNGEAAITEYCPLDLYSGDSTRVTFALRALWRAWTNSRGGINNLRIFADGKLVEPQNECSIEAFRVAIEEAALRSNSEQSPKLAIEETLEDLFIKDVLPMLLETSVLTSLARLQRRLDPLDIEGLFALYEKAGDSGDFSDEPTLDEWESFLNKFFDPSFQNKLDHNNPKPSHLRYYTMAYLLSSAFKDCSIFLHFGSDRGKEQRITIIDLDPKSTTRFPRWRKLDSDVVSSFKSNGTRKCVDRN